jgi:hypothetical protein
MKESDESPRSASREAQERREQGKGSVHGLQQPIQENRNDDVAHARDEVGCEAQPKHGLVREDIGRRHRRVTGHNELGAADESERSSQNGEQVEETGKPGLESG